MCGRYVFADFDEENVFSYYEIPQVKLRSSYNIAPGSDQLTIRRASSGNGKHNKGAYMMWGFKPKWFDKPGGVINARSESVFDKPMFKDAIISSRCIIPSTGFYEWKSEKGEKIPYFIFPENNSFISFAGIFNEYTDAGGKKHCSFAILTKTPNDTVKPIHNRMPVMLEKKDFDVWLDKDTDISELRKIFNYEILLNLHAKIVSRKVNNPENDDKSILAKQN